MFKASPAEQAAVAGVEPGRARFPAGLLQVSGSYRFGLDALLLAAFACQITERQMRNKSAASSRAVELGCGCGAAILAFAMQNFSTSCLGIDILKEHLVCACKNAQLLGLANTSFIHMDVAQISSHTPLQEWLRHCDCVMANPPWHKAENGKTATSPLRRKALWADAETLNDFCRAARELLRHHAWFCCILPPASLPEFCCTSGKFQLGLKLIQPVANMAGENAIRLLLGCHKEAVAAPELLAPLVLREKIETGVVWSSQALQFCPWLN